MRKNITVAGLLKKHGITPKKKLGQNFLIDGNLINKLVDVLDVYPDEDVLEIASGMGFITHKIGQFALEVLGIEKDPKLIKIAREEFVQQKNIRFLEADFLKLDLPHLLSDYHLPLKVLGNIPYNISSKIIFKLLENHALFQYAILTIQKEVAQRIVAEPGNKDYGILTILVSAQAKCEKLFDLEPSVFRPEPKVTSSVIKIEFYKKDPFHIYKPSLFKAIVKTAFNQRRKTIQNSLKKMLKNNKIRPWDELKIDPQLRAENLGLEQYVALANYLAPLL